MILSFPWRAGRDYFVYTFSTVLAHTSFAASNLEYASVPNIYLLSDLNVIQRI